jgi:hypothetical protein
LAKAVNVEVATYTPSGIVGLGLAGIVTLKFRVVVDPPPGVEEARLIIIS